MKTHSMVVIVLSVLIGAIMILSTDCGAPPSSTGPAGKFTVANEYIDFHSWYGEITWSGASVLNPALIVVSTSETSKNWDGSATLSAQGELTAAGITDVSVDAIYSRKFDGADLKMRKVYISVNDLYSESKFDALRAQSSNYNLATIEDYQKAPWLIKANTEYHLHIYYKEGGANKTHTHSFKTPDYPSSAEQADKLFVGENWPDGDEVKFFNTGGPSTVEIKRDLASSANSFEPFVFTRAVHYGPGDGVTVSFTDEISNAVGSCLAAGECGSGDPNMLLFNFTDHSSVYKVVRQIPGGTFGVVDLILFAKSIVSNSKTEDDQTKTEPTKVNVDGGYSNTWGGNASKHLNLKSITE